MAIAEIGFRVLIGSSFGDIFFNNCFQQGILPVTLDVATGAAPRGELTVDLQAQALTAPDGTGTGFEVNPRRKACLLEDTDPIGMSLPRAARTQEWQERDRVARPWVWGTVA